MLSKSEIVDDKRNIIKVCLFESFLAKYFLEHPEIFAPFKAKILNAIEEFVKINADNSLFERLLFSVFSSLEEQDRSLSNINLTVVKENSSLIMFDTFLKYFIERVMTLKDLVFSSTNSETDTSETTILASETKASSLLVGGQFTLFKISSVSPEQLLAKLRPVALFSDKNRGVVEIDNREYSTRNMGILSPKDTPSNFKRYLPFSNYPSRQFYLANESSEMAIWLRAHYLPVISGASGGIGKTIAGLAKIMNFSADDYTLMGLLIAASTIALGHHSFFEVMRPISFVTDGIQEQKDLLAFYEQVILQEIRERDSYKEHMSSKKGAVLIEDIGFKPECDNIEQLAPRIRM